MTDRILSDGEMVTLSRPSTPWDSITRREVCVSHRLLSARVKELEDGRQQLINEYHAVCGELNAALDRDIK